MDKPVTEAEIADIQRSYESAKGLNNDNWTLLAGTLLRALAEAKSDNYESNGTILDMQATCADYERLLAERDQLKSHNERLQALCDEIHLSAGFMLSAGKNEDWLRRRDKLKGEPNE